MKHKQIMFISKAAIIAAFYIVLGFLSASFSSGPVQLRISESLCVLAVFSPAAVYGVTIGCLLFNFLSGAIALDIILGTLASLIGVTGVRLLTRFMKPGNSGFYRSSKKAATFLLPLPYIISNTLIVPFILTFYSPENIYGLGVITIGAGELLSAGLLGFVLFRAVLPFRERLFGDE